MPAVVVERPTPAVVVERPTVASEGPEWARVRPTSSRPAVSTRMQERLQEKRTVERRRQLSTGAVRILVVALAAGAVWLALMSPLFAFDATAAEVSGTGDVVDMGAVTAVVAQFDGQSLATMNTRAMALQLDELQGVREARVERVWPHGVRITITTRVPVAAIAAPAGGYVLLDDQAVQISTVEAPPPGVPVVGIPPVDNERVLRAVIGVVNALPADLRARVSDISAQTEDSVVMQLRDGPRVEWGSAEQSELKAEVLAVMLSSGEVGTAPVIDVSAPTLPITRNE